ncbi:leucine-rich repeat-containing protein 23 [Chanos chanos]|uniref:Leucine-rich repeat-containing protein 23 n=1 Tax=Chanos chanos TaxID=29144 RepID=A0A6J2UWB0_CHACN|nr:leucine-rich repeat-containing protein 23 [Chanos chanos]
MSEFENDVIDGESEREEGTYEQENERIEPRPLTQEMIAQGLSQLSRTANGLSHAFVKLDLKERQLTDIGLISSFVHLRYLDISFNHLSDLSPLSTLTHLLWIKGDGNQVQSFKDQPLGQMPYLQWLSLAINHLNNTEGLCGPALERLNLTGNGIQRVSGLDYHKLSNLVVLELRGNRLETTDGIYLPNLQRLYMAQNNIKHLEGLEKLERLTTLHLRDNKLKTLDGLSSNMKSLQYLNVRGNSVFSQRDLRGLMAVAQTLRALVLAENPLAETENYRLSVLTHLPLLERLDKNPVSSEERTKAKERSMEFEDEDQQQQEDY